MEISAINNVNQKMVVREVLSNYVALKTDIQNSGSQQSLTTEKQNFTKTPPLSDNQIDDLAKKLNTLANNENLSLEFSMDERSGKQIMKFVDQTSHRVIQQFPSEEMIHLAAQIDKFLEKNHKLFPVGSIFNERI